MAAPAAGAGGQPAAAAAPAAPGAPGAPGGAPAAAAAVGGAGAAAPAVIQAAVGGVPAPAAMPAPAAEDSLIEQMLTVISNAGANLASRFKRWLWSAPITAPTTLAALSKLADTENLIYKRSGWVGRLEEIAREAQEKRILVNGIYRPDIMLRDIAIAKQASKYAHLCGFDLMRRFLIYNRKYGKEAQRNPTDPLYKLSRRGLIKALLIYLLALADKAKARVSLFYIGNAIGIYEEEGNSNSAFEVGNGSSDKILIESMPIELKQNLNQFIEMLSTTERDESLLEPGGGYQQNAKLPLIRGLGDIDDVTTDAQRAAYDAVISSARAVIDKIEQEEAEQLRDYLAPNRGRVDYTSALEKLVNPPAAPPRGGGAGAGAGAALALLAPSAGAASGGGSGGAGAGAMPAAPYRGPQMPPLSLAGGLQLPSGAAAGGGGGAMAALLAAANNGGAGAAAAGSSSSSAAAAAPAPLPAGFLAAGGPPPPPPPPGGGGAGVVENSNGSNSNSNISRVRGVGAKRSRAAAAAPAAAGGGGAGGPAAPAAAAAAGDGNTGEAAAAKRPRPPEKQAGGARRTRRHRSTRKSHRRPTKRPASRKGHKSTRKQSKKHHTTRSRKH